MLVAKGHYVRGWKKEMVLILEKWDIVGLFSDRAHSPNEEEKESWG